MKIQAILTFVLFFAFAFPNQLQAQLIESNKKYIILDNEYSKEDLAVVFANSPQAMLYYQKGMSKGKIAKDISKIGTPMIGISILVLGVVIYDYSKDGTYDSSTKSGLLLTMAIFSVGVILDIISIPFYVDSSSKINSAVNHYNWEINNQPKKEIGTLHMGVTNNGLGLVYSF